MSFTDRVLCSRPLSTCKLLQRHKESTSSLCASENFFQSGPHTIMQPLLDNSNMFTNKTGIPSILVSHEPVPKLSIPLIVFLDKNQPEVYGLEIDVTVTTTQSVITIGKPERAEELLCISFPSGTYV